MKNNLKIYIWKYLILFSILILVFLWTFQVLFLDKYYRYVKTKEIKEIGSVIEKNTDNDNLERIIENAAYEKNACIEITNNKNQSIYSSNTFGGACLKENNVSFSNYKSHFIRSNISDMMISITNPRFDNETLVYALKINDNYYAFINTSLEPIDSTVTILKNQLIYVSIIVLILAFIIGYFISKHISNPIVKINKAAKKLSQGKFDVTFDENEDIEEIKELAKTLSYTKEELSKTDELRRDLMANVSHDLKTPLTMIKAYAEMAKDLNYNNKKKREENLNVIIEETDRLALLVNDILELSRLQENLDNLNIEEFDLCELIKNIIKRYDVFKEKEDYTFIFEEKNNNIKIKADKKKIEQVIYNLINNAINYTGEDNKVIIKLDNTKDNITVKIIDTGKGINKEDIPYIWDKYYKNKKKHKRNLIGTGLGLSIVKNILDAHNFNYGVESIKNKGTTFYFSIPKNKE